MSSQLSALSSQPGSSAPAALSVDAAHSCELSAISSQPLSANAARLREYLLRWACSPSTARTDRQISRDLCLPSRSIIELSDELLDFDVVVVARCKPPLGRWILRDDETDPDAILDAHLYSAGLRDRGRSIMVRAGKSERAVRAWESRRLLQSDGQRRLF